MAILDDTVGFEISDETNGVEMTADETTAARVAAPMSAERIAGLRAFASDETTFVVEPEYLTECLDEIARLRAVVAGRTSSRDSWRQLTERIDAERVSLHAVVAERDAEIARLFGWLNVITEAINIDGEDQPLVLLQYAQRAVLGEAEPDDR